MGYWVSICCNMPGDKLKNYLHLHLIVFIWGFTAVLGKLITIDALPLVWFRMGMAVLLILGYISLKNHSLKVPPRILVTMLLAGFVVALHWFTFFKAIKVSNISVALACLSAGAFFTALLEPLWYRRKLIWYELVFGILVIGGLYLIFSVETAYFTGIILALVSALLSAIFTLMNGKLIQTHRPSVIACYEMSAGVILLSLYLLGSGYMGPGLFNLSVTDWVFLFLLASVCTAYAFIASVKVMKHITPYTVMLTVNLEPVYGILLAYMILGESEKMKPLFYAGASVILLTVIANGILKHRGKIKNQLGQQGS